MYCAMCINEKNKKDALCFNINANNKCQIKKKKKEKTKTPWDWCFFFFLWALSSRWMFFLKEFMFHWKIKTYTWPRLCGVAFLAVGRRQAGGMLLCVGLVQGTHLALGGKNLRCLVLLVIPVSHNFGSSNLLCQLPSDTITVHVSSARGKVPPAPAPSGRKPFWSGNH